MPRKFDRMPDLPLTIDDARVEQFMEHYYAMSNAPNNDNEGHDGWTDMFTEDATYAFNDKVAVGHAGTPSLSLPFPCPPLPLFPFLPPLPLPFRYLPSTFDTVTEGYRT